MPKIIFIGILLLLFAVFIVLALLKLKLGKGASKAGVYYLKDSLFSAAERSFLGVVERNLPVGVRIFGKVRLEDFLGVVRGLEAGERQAARNRINRKHVDFLLVRATDLKPLAAIELDDRSHDEADRQQRDSFVDSAFASAGLPILHVPAHTAYNPGEIKAKISALLGANQMT